MKYLLPLFLLFPLSLFCQISFYYDKSKNMLKNFIKNNEENQLSGSAHFWLGKIYIFESNGDKAIP